VRPDLHARLRPIARHGLGRDDDLGRVGAEEWPQLLDALVRQRLCGHAVGAVDAGSLRLAPVQYDMLAERHEEQLALDLRVERMLIDVAGLLEAEGIEFRVLKGPAVAHRFYDDPARRSFGDGDILVRGDALDAVVATLAGQGMHRRFDAPRASFDRRFVKAVSLVGEHGMELDVHRALTPGPYGVLLDADAFLDVPADQIELGGRSLPCLPPEHAFVHTCAHATLGDREPRFVPVRDVAEMLRAVDTSRAIELFLRFGCEVVAHRALALVESVLGLEPAGELADWARTYAPTRADQWRLRVYAGAGNRYAAQAAATFWVLPSLRAKAAYASALAFPDRRYLHEHDGAYARRVARGMGLVWRGRPW
jgi:hypothetical protein